MISAPVEAEKWLASTLGGDVDLGTLIGDQLYSNLAPGSATYPFLIVQYVSGRPVRQMNEILWHELRYQVMAVTTGESRTDELEPIQEAVQERLERATGETDAAIIIDCRKREDYEFTTFEVGQRFERLGSLWQILIKPKEA